MKDILEIKNQNEEEYKLLLLGANMYSENKDTDGNKYVRNLGLNIVISILNKYGIKYTNDLF